MNPYEVIFHPFVTEKTMMIMEKDNALQFAVSMSANKKEIKEALEKMFDIEVVKVSTRITKKGKIAVAMGKRLIHQRRGSANTPYTSPSFLHKGHVSYPEVEEGEGIVRDIIHNPGTTSPLSIVEMSNGEKVRLFAPEGIMVGDKIKFTNGHHGRG